MKITRLRLLGFKSFVEPAELIIEAGLTGVVGPNGCGKSNLLEALRWVMGETSYKSMRASSMDEVIFSGTTQRPARNGAEVTIFLDNQLRAAPAEFNDTDVIEITRHIERDSGSTYRVNGREVRARDVKILFEDAATGARSPALVKQGQISEIVNAKPEQRRRVLEDAAGIAGLYSRRHEAELRLRAAEGNLERLDDVLGQLNTQMETLKRQARQARRYKDISGDIRRAEAILLHLVWQDAHAVVLAEEADLAEAIATQAMATEAEARAIVTEASAGEALAPLREEEARRGAAVARINVELANLEREAERAHKRAQELLARERQITSDLEREQGRLRDAGEALEQLAAERQKLADAEALSGEQARALAGDVETAGAQVAAAEAAFAEANDEAIAANAQRAALAQRRADTENRQRQLAGRLSKLETELAALRSAAPAPEALDALSAERTLSEQQLLELQEQMSTTDATVQALAGEGKQSGEDCRVAELTARELQTEAQTLERLLSPDRDAQYPPVLDSISVTPGYERALAAALGDDLEASLVANAPAWWRGAKAGADLQLPAGSEPLIAHVSAPEELWARLRQVGVVGRDAGQNLQPELQPGQRLVSLEGDLWRWDGFAASGEAPTAAAQRLAQKNRLNGVRIEADEALAKAELLRNADRLVQERLAAAEARARDLRQSWRDSQARHGEVGKRLAALERQAQELETKGGALDAQRAECAAGLADLNGQLEEVGALASALKDPALLEPEIKARRSFLDVARTSLIEAKSGLAAVERERMLRADRLDAIAMERRRLENAQTNASEHISTLQERAVETANELGVAQAVPSRLEADRQRLANEAELAEASRRSAADALAEGEAKQRQAAQTLRAIQGELSAAREARARGEARLEAARARRGDETRKIEEAFGVAPEQCLGAAGIDTSSELPSIADIERRLARLKADRERLGGVNLAADDELETISAQVETMVRERGDVEAAIAKLRAAIGKLNREGKQRLDDAFCSVNEHFQELFETLFGGGEARLEMIQGEDPLEGGLEIVAKPPGKKPTTLSLLSGGEQTLTALSLIFAVFLTNPSPICVLDEVDAPLDDANVDRFCTLMEKMAQDTETRFLVITHHPMTMARMNRLFGVTMAEKGVSQLVSVDLATAERFAEAS